jgi:hypothetical protein
MSLGLAERLALGSANDIEVALRRICEWRPLPACSFSTAIRAWSTLARPCQNPRLCAVGSTDDVEAALRLESLSNVRKSPN